MFLPPPLFLPVSRPQAAYLLYFIYIFAYLLDASTASARESHRVPSIVIGSNRGHAVVFVHVKRDALNGGRAPQGLVEVLAAKVIVYLQRLWKGIKVENYT